MNTISATELKKRLDEGAVVHLIDVREPYELEICALECAHIPMAEIGERLQEVPKDIEVVIFCRSGKRAEAVINWLEAEHGFSNLTNLEGGIMAWAEEVDDSLTTY